MKIYINEQLIKSEVLPLDTPTLDETLETFSFALKAVPTATPYAPMQAVRIEMENQENDVLNLVLVSDSVTTFSLNPLRYKHSITCIQNTRKLSKHLVRNSVFSQPAYLNKKSFNAQSAGIFANEGEFDYSNEYITSLNQASEKLSLDSKEKIAHSYLQFKLQFMYGKVGHASPHYWNYTCKSVNEILDIVSVDSLTETASLTLQYKNAAHQTITQTITPSTLGLTEFPINKDMVRFDLIKNLANEGCYDFELLFDNGSFLNPTVSDIDNENTLEYWMVQVEIVAETYYNSAYDVLNLLAERQKQEDGRYSKKSLFSLPVSGELHDLLVSTVAPNFTFTQLTMYECVAEVFRLFDAIFTMDEDGELGIEYFNDYNKEPLENPKFVGRQLSLSEDKYTNGLISYYQDGRIVKTYPEHDSFAHLRSERLGIPDDTDHSLIVQKPIQSIVSCFLLPNAIHFGTKKGTAGYTSTNGFPIEVTRYVIDESLWSSLDTGGFSPTDDLETIKQANSIYFEKNNNVIKVSYSYKGSFGVTYYAYKNMINTALVRMGGMRTVSVGGSTTSPIASCYVTSPTDDEWNDIKMKVTYVASLDGRVKVESIENKYEGETLVDQVNGAVDLNKLGLNMLGLSLKMGEPTLNAAHRISTWDKRIKTGDIYQYEGGTWVANVCAYTFVGDHIQGNISFVKNFNSLALRTQLFREKRVSNISRELTIKSEDNYIEYCYYTTDDSVVSLEHYQEIAISKDNLSDGFLGSLGMSLDYKLGFGSLKTGRDITIGLFPTPVTIPERIYIDLSVYGAGNMLCFEFAFDSPMNAGNKTVFVESEAWFGSDKYFTSAVKYTDEAGFMDTASIEIIKGDRKFDFDTNFPTIIESNPGSRVYNDFLEIPELRIYKQPNEIFALNYEICFLPYPTRKAIDFIGSAFINKNFFTEGESFGRTLYFYYADDDFKYSILDTEGHGTKQAIGDVTRATVNNYFKITFWHGTILTAYKNWAVCDENGKILFASNTGAEAGSISRDIFFVPRHNRLS